MGFTSKPFSPTWRKVANGLAVSVNLKLLNATPKASNILQPYTPAGNLNKRGGQLGAGSPGGLASVHYPSGGSRVARLRDQWDQRALSSGQGFDRESGKRLGALKEKTDQRINPDSKQGLRKALL